MRACFFLFLPMKRFFFVLMAVALLASCRRGGRPADVLDAPQMVDFLADAYLLEGFYAVETQYRYDAMPGEVLRAYDDILDKHHLTREQVEHSFTYYSEHPDLYKPIQDSVLARLESVIADDTIAAQSSSNPTPDFQLAF